MTAPASTDNWGRVFQQYLDQAAAAAANALILTFDTASKTLPAATATTVVTTTPALTSYGYTEAQAAAVLTAINDLVADVAAIREFCVAIANILVASKLATS